MGYNLRIGELSVDYDNDEDCPYVTLSAEGAYHDDAPAFGELGGKSNEKWPSYTGWHDFSDYFNLGSLFYGKGPNGDLIRDDHLIQLHPGVVPLTKTHLKEIEAAVSSHKIKHPNATPTYGEKQKSAFDADENNPEKNWQYCRLVWLHYWVKWALKNCERPVFANS